MDENKEFEYVENVDYVPDCTLCKFRSSSSKEMPCFKCCGASDNARRSYFVADLGKRENFEETKEFEITNNTIERIGDWILERAFNIGEKGEFNDFKIRVTIIAE